MSHATGMETLAAVFTDQVKQRNTAPALHSVHDGHSVCWSWAEVGQRVYRWVDALHQLGVERGDHVVHWAANRPAWVVTDLALNCLGAVHVPIHSTLSGRQAAEQIIHSEARFAIVADKPLFDALARYAGELQPLTWISYDAAAHKKFDSIRTADNLLADSSAEAGQQLAEQTAATLDPQGVTTILYTSGTTGEPKGIMLSQQNLLSNATALVETFQDDPLETRLNFLPLSHIFGRTCDLYTWVLRGAALALTQSRDTIFDDCKRFRPTVINGVPFFFERVRQKLEEKGKADQPGILREVFGGRLEGCFSGGGALAEQTLAYYADQDMLLMQGYGLTESSPVISFSTRKEHRRGTSGPAVPGVEIRIAEDGEILARGPNIMLGYWKNEAATREALRDDWLHTGDLGHLDEHGHLTITGRKTEMLVTATGKNVFPDHIEELLCGDPLILQAVVFGDGRQCLSALIVPDPDVLKAEIKQHRIWVFSKKGAVRNRRVQAAVPPAHRQPAGRTGST